MYTQEQPFDHTADNWQPFDRWLSGPPRILSDSDIFYCAGKGFITPFQHDQVRAIDDKKIISYGTSSYGYDLRADYEIRIFKPTVGDDGQLIPVDPKNFDERVTEHRRCEPGEYFIIPPHGFFLCSSIETIRMPYNVTGEVLGKSTYARCGLICIATPLEAGWEGQVTLEFHNSTPCPVLFYPGEGCCQVLFYSGHQCFTTYADRSGKYQHQRGITFPKV